MAVSSRNGNAPDDDTLLEILRLYGCEEIELLGCGTAQARIRVEWAEAVAAYGYFSLRLGSVFDCPEIWVLDIDLP